MGIIKFFPLFIIGSLSGLTILNREISNKSEELEVNELSGNYQEIEKDWGFNNKTGEEQKIISYWKKEEEGFKRSKEGRPEIYKDIFIFDLCNQWVKFGGGRENQEEDISEGYGYIWKDICEIVKNGDKEINWLKFVTKVMKESSVVQVEDCCKEGDKNKINCGNQWNNGKWIGECFQKIKESLNTVEKKKKCKSIWNKQGDDSKNLDSSNQNCLDEEIEKKISEKIKIRRQLLGESENNYFCKDNNGYKKENGNNPKKITQECKKTLEKKIKEFLNKGEEKVENRDKKNICWSFYKWEKIEVKCEDGWIIRNTKI